MHGFIRECAIFFKFLLSLLVSFFGYPLLGRVMDAHLPFSEQITNSLSFLLLYTIFYLLSNLLLKVRKEEEISLTKRVGGGCIGLLKGVMIVFFILFFLTLLPLGSFKARIRQNSFLASYFLIKGEQVWSLLERR